MLSNAELAAIRADIAALLPDTGVILSVTRTPTSTGGFTEAWGTVTTTAYRLDPLRGQMAQAGGALEPYHTFVLTLPYDAVITTANRFQDAAGKQYSVTGVDSVKSWTSSVRATVEAI